MTTRRALLGVWAVFSIGIPQVRAETPSSEDIIRKLSPRPLTRSVRGVTVSSGEVPQNPSIDLYVLFDFDSARLQTEGLLVLDRLGAAFRDPRLAQLRFEVAGHTDAVGTNDYNQRLSELRAKAAVGYLTRQYKIAPDRLVSVGYGSSRLRDPSKPADGINRRVQITNLGEVVPKP